MPFTASHIAAVLPLSRRPLSASALVIGSMVPDLPLFTAGILDYSVTHSWRGVVTTDLLVGAVAYAAWHAVLAPAVLQVLPPVVRQRVQATLGVGLRMRVRRVQALLSVCVSLVVGASTHIVWDAFTHPGRWGTRLVPWLSAEHGSVPGHALAQHASTVAGAAVVVWWAYRWLRANDVPLMQLRLGPVALSAWSVVLVAGCAAAAWEVLPYLAAAGAARADTMSFLVATAGIRGSALAAVLLAFSWRLVRRG